MPFKCSIAHQLLLKFTKSLTVFEQHCPQYDLNVLVHWLSFFEHHCFQYTDSSFNHLLLPPADLNTACFSSQGPLYCPQVVKFSRSVKKCWCNSCQGFCKLDRYSSCLTIFLFWNQLSYFKDHVYWKSSLLKWNQRCPFLKRPFENQAFFFSKIQHTLFEIYGPLIVMYFENRNWPVVRQMAFFFMVLCIHFRLWFWGISFDGLWWGDLYVNFKNKTQVKSQALSREVVSFWAFILSACIITNSLIHEVTTLMEKLFKFRERHLSVQIVYLIKKGF